MQEILTVITYLVVWLICKEVVGIQSGLVTLLISLGAAVSVYVIFAVRCMKTEITTITDSIL